MERICPKHIHWQWLGFGLHLDRTHFDGERWQYDVVLTDTASDMVFSKRMKTRIGAPCMAVRGVNDTPTAMRRFLLYAAIAAFTLQPGDTDDDYFADDTTAQAAWRMSARADQLGDIGRDMEERNSAMPR